MGQYSARRGEAQVVNVATGNAICPGGKSLLPVVLSTVGLSGGDFPWWKADNPMFRIRTSPWGQTVHSPGEGQVAISLPDSGTQPAVATG